VLVLLAQRQHAHARLEQLPARRGLEREDLAAALLAVGHFRKRAVAPADSDDAQARFDQAIEALEAEQVYTARRLLKELLVDYPTLHRARLELARADYLARDFDAAEEEVLRVLDDPEVPPSVQTTLLAFLAQIRDDRTVFEQRHGWGGQLYGGLIYDSNVNYGVNDIIDVGGLPFTNRELSDWGVVIDGGLLHTFNPGRTFESNEKTGYFLWQTQGNGYYRAYTDESDFNLGVLTLRTGPAWVVPDTWRASIGLQGDQLFFGGRNLAWFTTLNPQYTRQLSDVTDFTISLTAQERDYNRDIDRGRDGRLYRAAAVISKLYMDRKLGSQAGLAYADVDAKADRFSYKGPEVFAGLTYEAWERGQIYGRIGYRRFDFEGAEPLFGQARDDDEWRFIAGFRHELASTVAEGWTIRGEFVATDNKSNLALFDYDRYQVNLGLQKNW